jgi:AbrB family looped-hinge helix DNA binding protein
MNSRVTLDKAGRIILPKPLRDELRLQAGDTLEVETSSDEITLRPSRGHAQLRKKSGVWVYRSGEPLSQATVDKAVQEVHKDRENQNLGKR